MEAYDYQTPEGYGDTYYVYAFDVDASGANLTPGSQGYNQRVGINDGAFLMRWWTGAGTYGNAAQGIQLRDRLQNDLFSYIMVQNALTVGSIMNPYMNSGWPVVPEVFYPESGYIGIDINDALPNAALPGQLAFHGVRRRKGIQSDPVSSPYAYYEKPYQYQVTATIPGLWSSASGGVLITIPITDFDFELRRLDGFGAATASLVYSCPG